MEKGDPSVYDVFSASRASGKVIFGIFSAKFYIVSIKLFLKNYFKLIIIY
jgi:hypothetical protein